MTVMQININDSDIIDQQSQHDKAKIDEHKKNLNKSEIKPTLKVEKSISQKNPQNKGGYGNLFG